VYCGARSKICPTSDPDLGGVLLAISEAMPGACHDRRAINEVGWEELLGTTTWIADPAYQGTSAITPAKRKPGTGTVGGPRGEQRGHLRPALGNRTRHSPPEEP
jgi:hypothetical protein